MKKILLLMLVFTLALCLGSCGDKNSDNNGQGNGEPAPDVLEYSDSDKYTLGDGSTNILLSVIDIEWPYGSVEFREREQYYISFSEFCVDTISDNQKMRYYYNGERMLVKPAASGTVINDIPQKDLTVYVPSGYTFSEIYVNTESADIVVADMKLKHADFETVSGNVSVDTPRCPSGFNVVTDSGNVDILVPESSSFTLTPTTASGTVECLFDAAESEGVYTVGSGKSEINVKTESGYIKVGKSE